MDEKYEFIRGEHPNETVAYLLAEDVAKVLRDRGRNVEVETVDEKRTNIWYAKQLLAGKKLKPHLSVRPGYIRALRDPFLVFFNFHNCCWRGSPPAEKLRFERGLDYTGNPHSLLSLPNYFTLELPAVYSKKDEELEKGLIMLDDLVKQSKAVWYSGNKWFYGMAANEGYASFTDIEASRKAGLMSDKIVRLYADEIDKLAEEHLSETRVVDRITREIFSRK